MLQGRLAASTGYIEKQREFLWRLGDAHAKGGRLDLAEAQLKALLDMPLSEEQRLEALCFLAEIQVLYNLASKLFLCTCADCMKLCKCLGFQLNCFDR